MIGGGNGIGQQVPPFFVFPGKRMQEGLLEGASAGASGTISESGWSNTEIFSQYMQENLIKYLPEHSEDSYVLVLYDGHKSHVSLPLIEWAKVNHIILFVLSPHCSHLMSVAMVPLKLRGMLHVIITGGNLVETQLLDMMFVKLPVKCILLLCQWQIFKVPLRHVESIRLTHLSFVILSSLLLCHSNLQNL